MSKIQSRAILTFLKSALSFKLLPLFGFFFILAFSLEAKLTPRESIFKKETVSKKETWQRLLYYKESFLGGPKSLVDAPEFFFSKNGKDNPLSELEANIKAFKDPKAFLTRVNNKFHPQCLFPARYQFLKTHLKEEGFVDQKCPQFNNWFESLNTKSISMVYSSSYANNPASMFGHTMLKFNQYPIHDKSKDMMNYAVTFSAQVPDEDLAFAFAFKGLLGFYNGTFSLTPYYTKINEYNNLESRDLWEYEFDFSQEEVDFFVKHIWEMYANSYLDYYFTDENCSSVLFESLGVLRPNLLKQKNNLVYVLPTEIIKYLNNEPGLVKKRAARPSLRRSLIQKYNRLASSKKDHFKELLNGMKEYKDEEYTESLSTFVTYLNYQKNKFKHKFPKEEKAKYRKALIALAQKDETDSFRPKLTVTKKNRPDLYHLPSYVGIGAFQSENGVKSLISAKFGYHDFLDGAIGPENFNQLDLFHFTGLYDFKNKSLELEKAELYNLKSIYDYNFLDPQLSWFINGGVYKIRELNLDDHKFEFNIGVGFSKILGQNKNFLLSFLGGLNMELSDHFEKGYKAGPNLEFLTSYDFDFMRSFLKYNVKADLLVKKTRYYYSTLELGVSKKFKTHNQIRYFVESNSQNRSFKLGDFRHYINVIHQF